MEAPIVQKPSGDSDNFCKTPVPISKSPGSSPSIRSMTKTVIVSLAETVTHDITYGESPGLDFSVLPVCKCLCVLVFIERGLTGAVSVCFSLQIIRKVKVYHNVTSLIYFRTRRNVGIIHIILSDCLQLDNSYVFIWYAISCQTRFFVVFIILPITLIRYPKCQLVCPI